MDLEPNNKVEHAIARECRALQDLLISKNRSYGNSALEPLRCFTKASAVEQILVRIDDKLNRISRGGESFDGEDTEKDLAGYLILLRVARAEIWPEGGDKPDIVYKALLKLEFVDDNGSTWSSVETGALLNVIRSGGFEWVNPATAMSDDLIVTPDVPNKLRDLAWPEPATLPVIRYTSGCGVRFELTDVNGPHAYWKCVASGAEGYVGLNDDTWTWTSCGLSTRADNKATDCSATRAALVAESWPSG